jgi:hypothetical protein
MNNKNDLEYIVFDDYSIELLGDFQNVDNKKPILVIKSTFQRTSGGQGLYRYYKNQFFDSNNKLLENNMFAINGIICTILKDDYWGRLEILTCMLIKVSIKDRSGVEKEFDFNMDSLRNRRFINLFNYLSFLEQVDTHNACRVLIEKNIEIMRLNKLIDKLKP